jgi:CopG family transcriptional regulator/antitoxin EndoAI
MVNQRALGQKTSNNEDTKERLKFEMKKGYFKMGEINLQLAEEGLKAESEAYAKI